MSSPQRRSAAFYSLQRRDSKSGGADASELVKYLSNLSLDAPSAGSGHVAY